MNEHISVSERLTFQFHITLAMAVSVLRSIVAEFGEGYSHQGACVYVEGEADGTLTAKCIVGQAFFRWGILRFLVAQRSDLGNMSIGNAVGEQPGFCNLAGFDASVRKHLASLGVTMDDDAFTFLAVAQAEQDARIPWGDAITAAAEVILKERGESVGNPLDRIL